MPPDALDGYPADGFDPWVQSAAEGPLAELTPSQARAASHEGPILVLAGAGTGKTKTLTAAIAARIAVRGIAAGRILAVTFTNKAAAEMRERVQAALGPEAAPHWLGTFHGLGARQLRYEPEAARLRHGFDILDADDSKRLVKRSMVALGLGPRRDGEDGAASPKSVTRAIGQLKDALVTPEQALAYLDAVQAIRSYNASAQDEATPAALSQIYAEYQRRLREANAADFGDLLLWPALAMQRDESYRRRWAGRFDCILADEYQDINHGQYAWLMALGRDHRDVFIVGDDDQAIFAFRGGDIRFIRHFLRDVPEAVQVRLEENFRSTGHILGAANTVIAYDRERLGKTLFTSKHSGEPIEVVSYAGAAQEADGIAAEIVRRNAAGVPWDGMAVLYRGNALARGFEEALLRRRVPYQLMGDTGFYQRAEVKDALALLRLAARPEERQSDEAFRRVVNCPARGIGNKAMQAIEAEAQAKACSLLVAARSAPLPPKLRQAAAAFADMIQEASADVMSTLADQLSTLLDRSGYRDMVRQSRADDAEPRLEHLQELLALAGSFNNAQDLLDHGALSGQGAELDGAEAGRVKLMTLHKAKGLEFDHVFLPGWEAGLFPAQYSDLAEERRLAYVALTRGRKRVAVTYAAFRRGPVKRSMFIDELPDADIVHGWLSRRSAFEGSQA